MSKIQTPDLYRNFIPDPLYHGQLLWGQGGGYLESSANGLRITQKKPGADNLKNIETFFQLYGSQLQQVLSKKSARAAKHFVINLNYLFAKLTLPLSSVVNSRKLVLGILLSGIIFFKILSHLPKKYEIKLTTFALWTTCAVLLVKGLRLYQSWNQKNTKIRQLQNQFNRLMTPVMSKPRSIKQLGKTYAHIDQLWKKIARALPTTESIKSRLAFRQCIEKRNEMADDYYTVFHGQKLTGGILVDFLTEVVKNKEPERAHQDFKYLRLNTNNENPMIISTKDYLEQHPTLNDSFEPFKSDLLSVSGSPFDHLEGESALHYWLNNSSKSNDFTEKAIQALQSRYSINEQLKTKIRLELKAIQQQFCQSIGVPESKGALHSVGEFFGYRDEHSKVGHLYSICLPKKLVENPASNPVYHSRAFGQPIDPQRLQSITDSLQKVEPEHLQARILRWGLFPEKGIKIFRYNTLSKASEANYEEKLTTLVKNIAQQIKRI